MVKISALADEIARELARYSSEVKAEVELAKTEVAKDTAKELKSAGNFDDISGSYRKGWTTKKDGNSVIVYNRTDGSLTHLLEKGHVKANGTGRTRSFPHIGPAEERAIKEFTSRVEKAIQS